MSWMSSILSFALCVGTSDLHIDGQHFKDRQGRTVLLRGVNVSCDAKVPPFDARRPEDLHSLPKWGFNVVRLLFIWEAAEPERGNYDSAYLDHYLSLVHAAAARGLYVVVDFHQDGMARTLLNGCGEGFPDWAVTPRVRRATPKNDSRCAWWPLQMGASRDMPTAWRAFYANEDGTREAYMRMVEWVVRSLRHEPKVLGYDLLNEPHGDEVKDILPFYTELGQRINRLDPEAMIFATPSVWTGLGKRSQLPRPAVHNLVFAPHLYDAWVLGMHVWFGNSQRRAFTHMRNKADEWRTPILLGEFGAPGPAWWAREYVENIYQRLDAQGMSGTQWCMTPRWSVRRKDGWNGEDNSIVDWHGHLRNNFTPRPYAQAIAGKLLNMRADGLEGNFRLTWDHVPAQGETQIYVPPGAGILEVRTAGWGINCRTQETLLLCKSAQPGILEVELGRRDVVLN